MRSKLVSMEIPFPPNLMSSTRTAANMPTSFAREIVNMYASANGSGTKRNGVVVDADLLPSGNIQQLMHHVPVGGDIQILAVSDEGNIYLKNYDGSWTLKHSGLSISGRVRYTHFGGKLIVTNGVDNMLEFNGTDFTEIHEFVKDTSINLTFISPTQFTIESELELYPVGKKLQFRLGVGNVVEATVVGSSQSATVITVDVDAPVLTSALDEVYTYETPPAFSFIYAAHDRLWGFGRGALKANSFSNSVDRNRVFYTDGVNSATDWFDDIATLQSINLDDKMPATDELVGMAVKDGMTVFFFRNYIQLWAGTNPTVSGDMTWVKTIPLGCIHGDLIVEMPNDIAFLTRFGARTISRVLQTEQLDVGDFGSEVDPTISTEISKMLLSDDAYKQAVRFSHSGQGWFGFKPADKAIIFQINAASVGWSVFDGSFEDASCFLNTPDGKLYMAIDSQLFKYDEGVYSDNGYSITTKWWTPWLNTGKAMRRWANKYIEVLSLQGEPITLNIKRFKNYDSSSYTLKGASVPSEPHYWDEANWDASFFDNPKAVPEKVRDHFVADTFGFSIETTSTQGPLTLFGLKVYGVKEQ